MIDFVDDLRTHLLAGYAALSVNSPEEVRSINLIKRAGWMMAHEREISDMDYLPIKQIVKPLMEKDKVVQLESSPGKTKINAKYLIDLVDRLGSSRHDSETKQAGQIITLLDKYGYPVITWDAISGFSNIDHAKSGVPPLAESLSMLVVEKMFPRDCIVVFKDAHIFLNAVDTNTYRRALRNLTESAETTNSKMRRVMVFLQPDWVPHKDIEHCVTDVKFSLPDENQLDQEISYLQLSITDEKKSACEPELRNKVRHALRGFTQIEAQNALFYALAKYKRFAPETVQTIYQLKASALGKDQVLQIIDEDKLSSFDQFGGFENYFDFVDEVKACYTAKARKLNIKRPKGCVIIGIPGTGKSQIAMATAKEMNLPLVKFDLSAVFGSYVGQSETTMRMSLKRISALGPSVMLLDEADKSFSGVVSSASNGDSGTSKRVFGAMMSWMANENKETFVIMTMNRTLGVPPETLRAGRLDKTFYTTFPTEREREEILKIHLGLNGVDHTKLKFNREDWEHLVAMTDQFVGSEVEQLVLNAIRSAFRKREEINPTMEDFDIAKLSVSPMSVIDKDGIASIDDWCKNRAISVSKTEKKAKPIQVMHRRSLGEPSSN